MAFLKVKNRAISSLASDVTNIDTAWTLATGQGALFPASGDFHVTCEDEIAKCTSRTSDVLTVVRAQEGTTNVAHTAGKAVKLRITAGVIENLQSETITHSLATAINDFLVASGAGAFVKKTLAEVKTLLDWAADIATHAGLTTGTHGVGTSFIAKSSVDGLNVASHQSRHQLLGNDRLKILLNLLNVSVAFIDWTTRDAWTDYVTGTGSVVWVGILNMQCRTGATSGSIASLYSGVAGALSPHSTDTPMEVYIQPLSPTTDTEIWVVARYYTVTPTTFPSLTEEHIGWQVLNGDLYASNGNGVNGTQTDTGIDLAQNSEAHLLIAGTGGTEVKFYVNQVLKATHTTNLPAQWNYFCWLGSKNSAALSKWLKIVKVYWGQEV